MTASTSELVLVCPVLDTSDYLPQEYINRQFSDVGNWLWKKYHDKITDAVAQLDGMETANQARVPLSFYYMNEAGKQVPIPQSENVAKIAKLTKEVRWDALPVGGSSPLQIFAMHADGILRHPDYRINWHPLEPGTPGKGIWVRGFDPHRNPRVWTITPSIDYPNSPPIVTSKPPYTNDICWSGGTLHYTSYIGRRGGSPWQDVARRSTNPLLALIIELLEKYRLEV